MIEQLYSPAVRRVLETNTDGLPMVCWIGEHRPGIEKRVIAAHLAHLLQSTLLVDNDAA